MPAPIRIPLDAAGTWTTVRVSRRTTEVLEPHGRTTTVTVEPVPPDSASSTFRADHPTVLLPSMLRITSPGPNALRALPEPNSNAEPTSTSVPDIWRWYCR